MPDFPTSPRPCYPIEETSAEPEVLVSTHRDGSEQRRLKGAGRGRTFRLSFGTSMPITNTERLAIVNHFAAQNGSAIAFHWTHPERGEVFLVRYVEAPRWQHVGYDAYQGEVVLQEVPA